MATATTTTITVIQGHPDPDPTHLGHALGDAYAAGARDAGHTVHVIDVARLSFPTLRNRDDLERGVPPEPIRHAQALIAGSDHIVMIYPVWNGAMPSILKGFLEQVFRPAFMFPDAKPGERLGFSAMFTQRKALKGTTVRIVVTMQMPAFVYRWLFHPRSDKSPFRLAGMGPIRQSLIGLVETATPTHREGWLRAMRALGRQAR